MCPRQLCVLQYLLSHQCYDPQEENKFSRISTKYIKEQFWVKHEEVCSKLLEYVNTDPANDEKISLQLAD